MTVLLFTFMIVYFLSILLLIYGFDKIRVFEVKNYAPKTKFSIIVPFRNENENLPILLESISNLNYLVDLFEVILVDDESDFKFQVSGFKFQVSIIENIRSSNSPKKDVFPLLFL